MVSDMGMRTMLGSSEGFYGEDLGNELGFLLQRPEEVCEKEQELNIYRSGSAPPTVEGSLSAVGGLFGRVGDLSEEELRSDPAYSSYYYANVNLNPRLPPPAFSKEDSRFTRRLQAGGSVIGGIGDRRKANWVDDGGSRSLFSMQPGFVPPEEEGGVEARKSQASSEWLDRGEDGLIGLSGLGLGGRRKSLADIIQDDLVHTPIPRHSSRPASRNAFDDYAEITAANVQSMSGVQNIGQSSSHTYASALGASLSRSTTPDPQLVARAPSPRLPPVGGRYGATDKKAINGPSAFNGSSSIAKSADLVAAMAGMSLLANGVLNEENHLQSHNQNEINGHQNFIFDLQGGQNHIKQQSYLEKCESEHFHSSSVPRSTKSSHSVLSKNDGPFTDQTDSSLTVDGHAELHKPVVSSPDSYFKAPSSPSITSSGGSPHYQNLDNANSAFMNYCLGGFSINPASPSMMPNHLSYGNFPPSFENSAAAGAVRGIETRSLGGLASGPNLTVAAEVQNLSKLGNHNITASALQEPLMDPLYIQYLRTAEYAAHVAASCNDPSLERNYMGTSYGDLLGVGLQKAYLGALLSPQKSQYGVPFLGKSGGLNHGYYANPAFGLGMPYPGSPLASTLLPASPVGAGSPVRHNDRNVRLPSGTRNFGGGAMGWHLDGMDGSFASSLLEEFKSNKSRCFELSEIAGHVVDFSADQYGSRFIQQKLETATMLEKNMVFDEIIPQAFSLMTDVFGNYVIQKFFEHGTVAQRRELANQLNGHVLTLSLQMYGCRVIQKAIEVVELDQQTEMVSELDGHVMRCVRDQNGNHVIQKCIECIPEDAIEFIISSFYDQVVTLSTHPYGCRVIQRVLEHCKDPATQRIMMDEILQNVCMLAQDQYGNYVIQHVLEHGKPHERSCIIKKLAGQIVQMSQQKFASNVVEKCLSFGCPTERQLLVNEMLGSTDENEPLQAMMKDQFANYVVQKVLETCDDQQRELILSRIKVHLNALKKYTYGKHIVARVEKLVAAGERRMGFQSSYPSQVA